MLGQFVLISKFKEENHLYALFSIVADYCYYWCNCILSRQGWKFPEQFQ